MNTMTQPTRVVTGEVRFSYVSLLSPKPNDFGGDPKYQTTILLPKSDVATKAKIDAAIEAAKQVGKDKKWGGVIPPMVASPIHDGDGVRPSDGMPFGQECKGHWVFSASTTRKPEIIDLDGNSVIDPTQIYSGMYGRIALNFAAYSAQGKKGVGCYVATNVQKTRDGNPLGSSDPDAASDFGTQVNSAPMFNQANPVAPNAGWAAPTGQQPAFNAAPPMQPDYGHVPPAAQDYGQIPPTQPAIDPITGQPLGGHPTNGHPAGGGYGY
ncbi:MAG: ssDNA-binding protein [Enterococcus casseliflavus]